jgi:ribosomal protein S18 acetylase RimI-like enzyme
MGKTERASSNRYSHTRIRRANWTKDTNTVRRYFQEYREWLNDHRDIAASASSTVSSGLGSVDEQIAALPGAYGPPHGEAFLAIRQGEPVACGVLRELEPKVGEIKRLYVRADHRGPEFGKIWTSTILSRARELGYARIRADTLPSMAAAIQFYQDLGFTPIPAYWPHPVRGALFFEYVVPTPSSAPKGHRAAKSKPSGK